MIAIACYALLVLAWILDLLTPQSFVVAILMNGPIALSSLALQSRLTVRLMILAEIANVVAGYENGAAAGYHWDAIALGDRLISAATFILVGVLTIRASENARRVGESEERQRSIERERALRRAMETVRASLNLELVMRNAVREAQRLTNGSRVMLVVRATSLDVPDIYESRADEDGIALRRGPLAPEIASLMSLAREREGVVQVESSDPIGRLVGEHASVAAFTAGALQIALLIGWGANEPTAEDRAGVEAFCDNLAIALRQAQAFIQLAAQNDEIVRQRNEIEERGSIIRDLVYALAHDLRTPLAAADVTMTQALKGAYGDLPARYREILQTSIASNDDLRRLADTLLMVARYESGEDSQVRRDEPVVPLVRRAVEELRTVADAKNVDLRLDGAAADALVYADGDEVRRAVSNLIANAIVATPAGGRVTVGARLSAGNVTIDVIDDGFGIPPEKRGALFERFGGVRAGGGTGLGLYIVRRIAEKYGGCAGYEPVESGGSRFFIVLPELTKR